MKMSAETKQILNELLMKNFKDIIKIEELMMRENEITKQLTMPEIHTLECIAENDHTLMSDIAKELKITLGTLSVAVSKLIQKGYMEKQKLEKDKRVVKVKLTEKGECAIEIHKRFHDEMINYITENMDVDEISTVVVILDKINHFFLEKYNLTLEEDKNNE